MSGANASGMGLHGYEVIGNSTICDAIIDSSHSVMGFLSQNLYAIVLCETDRGGRLKAWFINHQRPWKNRTFLQQLLTNQGTQNNNDQY